MNQGARAILQVGNVDFATVGTMLGYEEKFDYLKVGEEELVAIVPCSHALAKKATVKLTELTNYPFINREETSGTRREIEKLFRDNRVPMDNVLVALELGSTESLITAVSEGRGIAIISSIAAAKAQAAGLAKILRIKEAKNPRKLYVAKPRKPLVKIFEAFWEFCRQFHFKNKAIACSAD